MGPDSLFWLVIMILFLILEMVTISLVSIWFVGGALTSFLISFVTGVIWIQVVIFLIVSVVLLLLLRPLARRFSVKQKDRITTGAKALIGRRAIVTEDIDNLRAKGAVQVNGQFWSAKTDDDIVKIPRDTVVMIKKVNGARLIVEDIGEEERDETGGI